MANSARRIRGNMSMEWMPEHLMDVKLKNSSMWSQHVKQLIMLTAGIETKSQEEMNKGQREDFILSEYNNWCDILGQKHPNAPVLRWLKFTTGTRTTRIGGGYLLSVSHFTTSRKVFGSSTTSSIGYGTRCCRREPPGKVRKKFGSGFAISCSAEGVVTNLKNQLLKISNGGKSNARSGSMPTSIQDHAVNYWKQVYSRLNHHRLIPLSIHTHNPSQ